MADLIDTDIVLDHLAAVPAATELHNVLADSGLSISTVTYMEPYQSVPRAASGVSPRPGAGDAVSLRRRPPVSGPRRCRCSTRPTHRLRAARRGAKVIVPDRAPRSGQDCGARCWRSWRRIREAR